MLKIQVMLDNNLAQDLKESARKAGLSISSYPRLLIASAYKKKLSPLERALLEEGEVISLDEFKQEIQDMINNA